MFSDIQMVRFNKEGTIELERVLVPIAYGQKEKWLLRITSDPDLTRSIQINLPRISFALLGLNYDPGRKQIQTIKALSDDGLNSSYMPVPYDFNFSLTVYAKNIEDGLQIIEQILPTFRPDYTMTLNLVDSMDIKKDVAFVLNDVLYTVDDEGIASDSEPRILTWDLNFIVKGWLFPAVSTAKIITRANTYIYDDSSKGNPTVTALMLSNANSFGVFSDNEIVFQGNSLNESTAKGTALDFDRTQLKLYITDADRFRPNVIVVGASSGAQYNLSRYYISSNTAIAMSSITPSPNTAQPGDAFGYDIEVKEWPNIP